jgi:hypothetical protein
MKARSESGVRSELQVVAPDHNRRTSDTEILRQRYWRRPRNTNDQKWDESGGVTFLAMMQATDLRYGYASTEPGRLDRARDGANLIEG